MYIWDDAFIYFMLVDENLTLREVAERLDRSTAGVHYHVHQPDFGLEAGLTQAQRNILQNTLDFRFNSKHIKGGASTKKLYDRGELIRNIYNSKKHNKVIKVKTLEREDINAYFK